MKHECAILISSAGRRGQLIDCFRDAGNAMGVKLRICAADVRPELSAACQVADAVFRVPPCKSSEFIPALRELCTREQIRLVIPTIDPELAIWSVERKAFGGVGTHISISDPEVVSLAGDKARTAAVLAQAGVRTPHTVSAEEFVRSPEAVAWPVILKPRGGSSSVGVVRPGSREEALQYAHRSTDAIVQELWKGREYTVNLFFDRSGSLRTAVPHWRIETRGGEVSKGRTEDVPLLRDAARKIAKCLGGARGALCFQAIVSEDGQMAVFEINARFGGGYPLSHYAGARFTQWLLEEALERPTSANDAWRAGVTMLRYDTAAFVG